MIDRIINTKEIKKADVVLISAPYEAGVSFMPGTSMGPSKVINCLDNNLELFDVNLLHEPSKKIKTAHIDLKEIKKYNPQKALKKITETYNRLLKQNKFPIILGGEHTVSLGALKAIVKEKKPEEITILQIDAHQDLRNDNSDYEKISSKLAHSCVMRRAHELGFNLVQVGIRTFSKYEYEYWQKNKKTIKVFEWNEKKPNVPKINEIINSIKTKKVYLSIDVDGFDPSFMPGTGTPVQGGIGWHYGLNLIERILEKKEVIAADIVEISPQRDSVLTEFGAALICYKIMSYKFKQK